MDNFVTLMSGGVALLLNPMIWFLVLLGTAYGIIAGAMPGIGATLAFGLVLPVTFALTPVQAVALLMSISVGVAYGNSIPAIMVGVPGTPAAILTVLDGFTLHKRGETGLAIGVAYVSAILGQLISIPIFVLALVPLSGLAYVFLAPEMFGLYLLGVVAVVSLTGKNVVKGLMAAALGLCVGLVGLDPIQFQPRFDFGISILRNGFDTAAVVIGLLALSELFRSARQVFQWDAIVVRLQDEVPWSQGIEADGAADAARHGAGDRYRRDPRREWHCSLDDFVSASQTDLQDARAIRQGIRRRNCGQRVGAERGELRRTHPDARPRYPR